MRKISLIPYKCEDGREYEVKTSLASVLFAPSLKLGVRDLIENDRIAGKIEKSVDDVLLEDAEYERIKGAIESFTGYKRDDLPLVNRVIDALKIEVKEA